MGTHSGDLSHRSLPLRPGKEPVYRLEQGFPHTCQPRRPLVGCQGWLQSRETCPASTSLQQRLRARGQHLWSAGLGSRTQLVAPTVRESTVAPERAGRYPRTGVGLGTGAGAAAAAGSLCTAAHARRRPITFHFGEGQDRTVAGAERGHPGRVLLHGEPATSGALPPPLATSWGRAACLGPAATRPPPRPQGQVPGCRPLRSFAALTAAAAPPRTSSPAGRAALHTRAHSLRLRACSKLQRHVRAHSPRPPGPLTCSAPPRAARRGARALPG